MTRIEAAVFDVDGVLLDSLDAHLQISIDEARRMRLNVSIPSVEDFRRLVAQGAVISPMEEFFHTVGFTRVHAREADDVYRRVFAGKYPVHPFPRIKEMLQTVAGFGVRLGIVTSNTRRNISTALGESLKLFDERCIFCDDDAQRLTKAQALTRCAENLGIQPQSLLYVGDQPRDFAAAREAHTRFLGVTYGWGVEESETRCPLAHSPDEIAAFIQAHAAARHSAQAR